jgi:peptide deformylase
VLINPEILEREGSQVEEEGCLSLPDIREKVKRSAWVKVRAQNAKGEFFEVEGEDLLARALEHEIDHLHGVLFIDRLSRSSATSSCAASRNSFATASGKSLLSSATFALSFASSALGFS